MKSVNYFEIKGKISSIRLNNTREAGSFFINSFVNKRDVNLRCFFKGEMPESVSDGDTVVVKGYITVMPPALRAPGEKYKQTFRATEVIKPASLLEEYFGEPGNFQSPDYFYAALKGVVTGVRDEADPRWKKITLLVDGDRHDRYPSRIALDYQVNGNRFVQLPEFKFVNGDAIEVICTITTSEKKNEDGKMFYQNLKVMDIKGTR